MTLIEWNEIVRKIDEVYEINFGYGDCDRCLPQSNADLEDAYFTCPHCGELIYYVDYADYLDEYCSCPICEEPFEIM